MFQIVMLVLTAFLGFGYLVVFYRALCAAVDVLFDENAEE